MWNVYRMFITHIYRSHRNPETQKNTNEIGSGTKLFITFELKGFSTWGERDTIFLCFSICPPLTTRDTRRKATASKRKSTFFFRDWNSTHWLFSSLSPRFRWVTSLICLVPNPIWDFYLDISEWHILPACTWTPALMLHLTNPSAERKVLSLTKPKGKIYKTKSLGHYITDWENLQLCNTPNQKTFRGLILHKQWSAILTCLQYATYPKEVFTKLWHKSWRKGHTEKFKLFNNDQPATLQTITPRDVSFLFFSFFLLGLNILVQSYFLFLF